MERQLLSLASAHAPTSDVHKRRVARSGVGNDVQTCWPSRGPSYDKISSGVGNIGDVFGENWCRANLGQLRPRLGRVDHTRAGFEQIRGCSEQSLSGPQPKLGRFHQDLSQGLPDSEKSAPEEGPNLETMWRFTVAISSGGRVWRSTPAVNPGGQLRLFTRGQAAFVINHWS